MRKFNQNIGKILSVLVLILLPVIVSAQTRHYPTTVIEGIVTDSISGEPLSYVSVFLKGSGQGTTTDDNGRFHVSTNDNFTSLQISTMGYTPREVFVNKGKTNRLKIAMSPTATMLEEVIVKPKKEKYSKKNNPAVQLLERIRSKMHDYDPLNHEYYSYDKYEKIVMALNDFSPEKKKGLMKGKFKFIFEFLDTSEVSGKPILPISVKEKSSHVLNRRSPEAHKEVIEGFKRSGLDEMMDEESIQRFLEDVFREIDIYSDDIPLMQNRFVSPLSKIASNYYKFYLDTVNLQGERCLELSFAPHNPESFSFNGRLYIPVQDTTLFIKKVVMNVPKAINLNYVKNIYIVQNFEKAEDGSRLKVSDDMTVEFQIIPGTQGLYARRQTGYRDFSFLKPAYEFISYLDKEGKQFYSDLAAIQPEQYWHDHRQIPIKENEQAMKKLLARLRQVPVFYWTEKVVTVLVAGYIKTGKDSKFDFGPMNTTISANTVNGARFRVGGMTTSNLSKHFFARGYVAYGCKDHKFMYGGEAEYSFNEKKYHSREFPINSLKVEYKYDLDQLGQHYLFTNPDNIFLSLKRQPDNKVTYRRLARFEYTLERPGGFSVKAGLKHEIQYPTRWLPFENGWGDVYRHYSQSAFTLTLRYAPGEKFYQTKSERFPINMDAPVFQITQEYGPRGMFGSLFTLNKTEISVSKRFWFSAFGYTDIILKAGKIWSKVQYPSLMWPNANLSYTIQPESYTLMNAMEFANDQYLSWDITYWANGALFNRVPLLKYLRLREVVSFRGLYGKLSDRNNPALNNDLFRFPFDAFTQPMGKKPYMELGVGIDNILTILRIDYVWRLTYRDTPNVAKGGLRIQLHFTF